MVMPDFDEVDFPFIALCGEQNISILDVNTLIHKPLISHDFVRNPGLQSITIRKDK